MLLSISVFVQAGSDLAHKYPDLFSLWGNTEEGHELPLIRVCFIFVTLCTISTIIVSFTLLIWKILSPKRKKRIKFLEERYMLLLTGIIFEEDAENYEEKSEKLVSHFKKVYLHSYFNKKVLRRQLLLLHKNFSGRARDILEDLYFDLHLEQEPLKELNGQDWSLRAEAVKELSQLQYKPAAEKIFRLTSHENPVLRLEAQAAMLSLRKENPFSFLSDADAELNEWQQMNLEEKAKKIELKNIPDFSQWFEHQNPTVVQFCVRMTMAYNQFESGPKLIRLLFLKDERVVIESIKALGFLMIAESQDELIEIYPSCSQRIQFEIIDSLGKIGGGLGIEFLETILLKSPHSFAMKAAMALRHSGESGLTILAEALSNPDPTINAVAIHMFDERI